MDALIIVGLAPSFTSNPADPLEGKIGKKIANLFGCTYRQYLQATQRYNILPEWAGAKRCNDRFPVFVARTNAFRMASSFSKCRVLIIGIGIARLFGIYDKPLHWKTYTCISGRYRAAILPHLSTANRWWNNQENRLSAKQFMQRAWRLEN